MSAVLKNAIKNTVDYIDWTLAPFTKLMGGGTNGFAFDASDISTLNQVSTGTTPVTAVTQPVGLMLDKHLGLVLGTELAPSGGTFDSPTGWSLTQPTSGAVSISGGALRIYSADGSLASAYPTATGGIVKNKTYRISVVVSAASGGCNLWIDGGSTNVGVLAVGTNNFTVTPVISDGIQLKRSAICDCTIESISVKLLDGNHAIQATAAARPSWQVDANGYHYAQLLGTDDSVSCATGGGGSTGFLFCAALKPTGGAGTTRFMFGDFSGNTGYSASISNANTLGIGAGNGAAITSKYSTATIDVGTTSMQTVWDDGVNLHVQANGGVVESVARPVVVAGTAGYTLFKSNTGASNFFIGDFYRAVYIKNWAGTAAQLAAIQAWVKAGAGL